MFEKLSRVEERYNKIAADLCDPAVVADISRYTALMKEQKHLTPVVETFARYKTAKTAAEEARELLQSESDPELCDLARQRGSAGTTARAVENFAAAPGSQRRQECNY